jgi:ComF family protein
MAYGEHRRRSDHAARVFGGFFEGLFLDSPVVLGLVKRFRDDLLETLYPPCCVVCRAGIVSGRFCDACEFDLREAEGRPQCRRCAAPVAASDLPCQRCGGQGYRLFESVVRLAVFEPPLAGLIHRLKFYHSWTLAEVLAERALELDRMQAVLKRTDVLVPVPLHAWRQTVRGFNQADVIAMRLRAATGLSVARVLLRHKRTAAQSQQTSRAARFRNMRDAFVCVAPDSVAGRRVLLIDDVITTGATLRAAAQAMESAKPAAINVFTLAAVDPKGAAFEYG